MVVSITIDNRSQIMSSQIQRIASSTRYDVVCSIFSQEFVFEDGQSLGEMLDIGRRLIIRKITGNHDRVQIGRGFVPFDVRKVPLDDLLYRLIESLRKPKGAAEA
jgi:hypothetical protein